MKTEALVKIAKIGGLVLSVAGTVVAGWAGRKENDKTLEKLVNEKLSK